MESEEAGGDGGCAKHGSNGGSGGGSGAAVAPIPSARRGSIDDGSRARFAKAVGLAAKSEIALR